MEFNHIYNTITQWIIGTIISGNLVLLNNNPNCKMKLLRNPLII